MRGVKVTRSAAFTRVCTAEPRYFELSGETNNSWKRQVFEITRSKRREIITRVSISPPPSPRAPVPV